MIDTASSMIVLTDLDGTVIAANPATTALTGFTEDELVGHPFWEQLVAERPARGRRRAVRRPGAAAAHRARPSCRPRTAGAAAAWSSPRDIYQANPDAPVTFVISATDVTAARENAGMVEHLLRSARTIAFVGTDLHGPDHAVQHRRRAHAAASTRRRRPAASWSSSSPPRTSPATPRAARRRGAFEAIVEHAAGELTPETRDWTWLPGGPRAAEGLDDDQPGHRHLRRT